MNWNGVLAEKVAIVTAGAAGIGEGTANRLASAGAAVVVVDIDEAGASRVAESIRAEGGRALAIRADATNSAEVARMVVAAVDHFGGIDILVNGVGGWIVRTSSVQETSLEVWEQGINLNVTSNFLCSKAVIPYLIARGGGRIVNIGSLTARAQRHLTAPFYATGKAAVHALTRYLAKELGPYQITVNVVAPGPIWAPRTKAFFEAQEATMVAETPLGRIGEPEDVGDVVVFLACDAARHITGATIDINGGYLLI